MPVERVMMYRTSDGALFETEKKAKRRQLPRPKGRSL